jgi:hypothetical protein
MRSSIVMDVLLLLLPIAAPMVRILMNLLRLFVCYCPSGGLHRVLQACSAAGIQLDHIA